MSAKVELHEGETIQQALRRLRGELQFASRRQLYKTRPGYYQKPSDRRRSDAGPGAAMHGLATRALGGETNCGIQAKSRAEAKTILCQ